MPFDSIGGLLAIYVEFKCLPGDEISINIWLPENHSKSVNMLFTDHGNRDFQ